MDLHCQMMMDEFTENYSSFTKIKELVEKELHKITKANHMYVVAIESRVKDPHSLEGKLDLKGYKYDTLSDITDLVGARIITFYTNEVDKIASLVEQAFIIDWENSVDKRTALATDQFGYMSLHYICRIPESLYKDPEHPEINEYRFEIQMRTALQHVWATVYHDTGYKSDIEVPKEYIRKLSRLAGLLEIADEEFGKIIGDITDYRRRVSALIRSGDIDEIQLNGDTFRSYLEIGPFDKLNKRIADINKAEIQGTSYMPFLEVFNRFEIKTLGELNRMIKENSEDAYRLAMLQLGGTDLDIVASTIGIRNICIVYILKIGGGEAGLSLLLDILNGQKPGNRNQAKRLIKQAEKLEII